MKVVCISDMHGNLNFEIPECDLLLIAGDICPANHSKALSEPKQMIWLEHDFRGWLDVQPIKKAVAVAGNHDWIWESSKYSVPDNFDKFKYIEDEETEYEGLRIYGTPVQLNFCNWAFNRSAKEIQKYWDVIPEGLDILLLHCPPYGILDETQHPYYASEHIGSKSLTERIEKVRPRYVVFGHNHGEHGVVEENGITYVNASMVDEEYELNRQPIVLEI